MILESVFSEYDLHMLSEESKMVMHTKGQMHYEYICKYILNTHKEGTYNENSKGLYQNYPGFPGEGCNPKNAAHFRRRFSSEE